MGQAWNRPTTDNTPHGGQSGTSRVRVFVIVALLVAAIGAACYFMLCGEKAKVKKPVEAQTFAIKEITPPRPRKMSAQRRAKEMLVTGDRGHLEEEAPKPLPNDPRFPYTDGRKVVSSFTNSATGQIVDRCIMPNGKRRKVLRNLRKPIFATATDDILAMATGTGGDEPCPPLPFDENMEDAFLDSLKIPIVINDDDSDEVKAAKERVRTAREQMIEGIANGGTFYSILNEHIKTQHENAETREQVMATVQELKESGDPAVLDAYLKEANTILGNLGASPVNADDDDDEEGETDNEKY